MAVGQWLANVSLATVLSFAIVACSPPGSASHSHSPVFLDAAGTCPAGYTNQQPRPVCLHDQYFGNGRAGFISSQHGPWGLAYAFNCWGKKRPFGMRIGLSGADFSWGEIDVSGRTKGRGSILESDKVGKPVQAGTTFDYLVEVRTTCTWHIRAVHGTPNVIRTYIPSIPRRKL
jgi:hypothetical protein